MTERPDKQEYYFNIALEVSRRSTCIRKHVGAVLVKNDRIISTGYNGAPRGLPNCIDTDVCEKNRSRINGEVTYDKCRAVHAEINAILGASPEEREGAILYLAAVNPDTGEVGCKPPCHNCMRILRNSGIFLIKWLDRDGVVYKAASGITEADCTPPEIKISKG